MVITWNDNYSTLASNMSESNIGARKKRNIRDHLFIVNGILNSVKQKEVSNIDIQLMDISKCFDAQWSTETMKAFYGASVKMIN